MKVQAEKVELVLEVALAELGAAATLLRGWPARCQAGRAVTAFVEGAALPAATERKLLALLAERLEKYERPRQLVYVPQFRMTATGKLDRPGDAAGGGKMVASPAGPKHAFFP